MKKTIKYIIIAIIILVILTPVYIYIINDMIANSVENSIKRISLPPKTELIDSISVAGKLTGNGNGMQYFGAILINTELNETELENYYSTFRKNNWQCLIDKQTAEKINIIEHGIYEFKNFRKEDFEKCYIVYSWGDSPIFKSILELDLRGH